MTTTICCAITGVAIYAGTIGATLVFLAGATTAGNRAEGLR